MADLSKIKAINETIEEYFSYNTSATIVPVKELMPLFIERKIFSKDIKKGKPIREILRALDKEKNLSQIPYVSAERSEKAVYWYFSPIVSKKQTIEIPKEEKKEKPISDETYVLNLCDTLLKQKASRQHKFTFLVGDTHKNGKTTTRIPIDAYYEELKLAIEFWAKPELEAEEISSKLKKRKTVKKTASGVSREEQRILYNERKIEVLPEHGIELIIIKSSDFKDLSSYKLKRNSENDLLTIQNILKKYI